MSYSTSHPPSTTPDAPLATAEARFHVLVLPHLDRMLGFAKRRTPSASDAEDAVQEACVRAWCCLDGLRDDTKSRAWLYRILRGVLSDAGEKISRRTALVSLTRLDDVHEDLMASDDDGVFAGVCARIDTEQLNEALSLIPHDFAVAVELHDIDGFKYHEIAEIVDVPLGTVMSRIARGRRLLAATIASNRKHWGLGVSTRATKVKNFGGGTL
ncbi:MAG: sigma-70 family RNA polymerase sigma factor [Gemmatimonadaceae bacterium]